MLPGRVALFVTCLVDTLAPEVGEATVAILRHVGIDVYFPKAQTCCGQPGYNSGFHDDARKVARTMLDAFETAEAVVAPSGSCVTMIRRYYPSLFEGTEDQARAEELATKTYELSEFLVDVVGIDRIDGRWPGRVTYHSACHGLRELGLSYQARQLLEGIDGLELVEMAHPEMCCGFGGTFSVRLADLSVAMADAKLEDATRAGVATLVSGDQGCLMHLEGRSQRRAAGIATVHLATLLAQSIGAVERQ